MQIQNDLKDNKFNLLSFIIVIIFVTSIVILSVSFSTQISTLQISQKLITEQFSRDLESIQTHVLNIQSRRDAQWSNNADNLAKINEKISELQVQIVKNHPHAKCN